MGVQNYHPILKKQEIAIKKWNDAFRLVCGSVCGVRICQKAEWSGLHGSVHGDRNNISQDP